MKQAMLLLGDWEAAGHAVVRRFAEGTWHDWLAYGGIVLLAGVLLWAILGALVRQSNYRAIGVLQEHELEQVKSAIVEVERRTSGELMLVLLERSDSHPCAHWLAGLWMLFGGSVLLSEWIPWETPGLALLCQLALGGLGTGLSRLLPDLHHRFISTRRATEMVEEQAIQEFHQLELYGAGGRTGVLILVSLLEHRVVILADEGIHQKVGDPAWIEADKAILEQIRKGHLGQGLVTGVRMVGAILTEHYPSSLEHDELPNVVIVRSE